jgi:phenylpropionate dioxygenase-like ring-hydroxylating dioxygenase large terminal subunit
MRITDREIEKSLKFKEKRWAEEYPALGTDPIAVDPHFTSQAYFELEREKIWRRVWLNVGRVEDCPNAGDFFVKDIEICNTSILVVRGEDGEIRAFHNVCSHRLNKVVWDACGSERRFACRFHGFVYDTRGTLVGMPDEQMFFDLDPGKLGLTPVAAQVWEGFIFINLAREPEESLEDYLGELGDRLVGHPFHEAPSFYEYRAVVHCNWKILMFGFLEAWHVPFLHAKSGLGIFSGQDNPLAHTLLVKLFKRHRLISLYGNPDVSFPPVANLAGQFGKSVMQTEGTDSETANPTKQPCWSFDINNIFPNFQLNAVNETWYRHHFWPLAIDRTIWETRVYFPEAEDPGQRFSQEYSKVSTRDVLLEDGSTLEQTQSVLASGAKTHFHLQDDEIAVRHFHKVVQDYVGY